MNKHIPLTGGFGNRRAFPYSASSSDVTAAANVGLGTGLFFRDIVSHTLNLRTLKAGTGLTIVTAGDEVTIGSTLYGDVYWLVPVISIFNNTIALPVGPTSGDRYIAQVTGNGWVAKNIYEWDGAVWVGTAPIEGMVVYNKGTDAEYQYGGTAWSPIVGSGTLNYLPMFTDANGHIGDSFLYTDPATCTLYVPSSPAAPSSIVFCEAAASKIVIEKTDAQDLLLYPYGKNHGLRVSQATGHTLIGHTSYTVDGFDTVTNLYVLEEGPARITLGNFIPTDNTGLSAGLIKGEGYDVTTASILTYGQVNIIIQTPGGSPDSYGIVSLAPRVGDNVYSALEVYANKTSGDTGAGLKNKAGNYYAQFDASTQSLTIGHNSDPHGILHLISDESVAISKQTVTNVGSETAQTGTFRRTGHVYTRKDMGLLSDDGSLYIVPATDLQPHVGTGHVWMSGASGYSDHVLQANFTFDWDSISIFNAVGAVANADTDGYMCIIPSGAGLIVKNRLGFPVTMGYSVDYYDNPALETFDWESVGNNANWRGVAMSSNGAYQTAVANGDYLYISTDNGQTWTTKGTVQTWYAVALSSSGQYQYAAEGRDSGGGFFYRSSNYGVTWTKITASPLNVARRIQHITTDSTGQYVSVCVAGSGYIYISADYGVTWAKSADAPLKNWAAICADSTGAIQYAVAYGSKDVYKSVDYGDHWSTVYSFGTSKNWDCIACSSDGVYLTVGEETGRVYISSDSGVTLTVVAGLASDEWHEVCMSATGQYQTLLQKGTLTGTGVYHSNDYGVTWTQYNSPPASVWWAVAMSSTGTYRTVVGANTDIYILA
jgi:hypothetical protein